MQSKHQVVRAMTCFCSLSFAASFLILWLSALLALMQLHLKVQELSDPSWNHKKPCSLDQCLLFHISYTYIRNHRVEACFSFWKRTVDLNLELVVVNIIGWSIFIMCANHTFILEMSQIRLELKVPELT